MTLTEFKQTLNDSNAPNSFPPLLRALWHDAKGNWDTAHKITQDIESSDAAWVYAYLHRKEGDLSNASYWYARAGKKKSTFSLEKEWEEIVMYLLSAVF